MGEYIVAQYLIANKIPYLRERFPFEDRKFRSDFLIRAVDGKEFHIEVWGYAVNEKDRTSMEYNEARRFKEHLYNQNKLNLISIDGIKLNELSYYKKQIYIKNKLKEVVNKELVVFDDISFLHHNRLTDDQILEILMRYSENNEFLPAQETVKEAKLSRYLGEIRKRHESYFDFARKFGKQVHAQNFKWDDKEIYNAFKSIVKDGLPISKNTISEYGYSGMLNKLKIVNGNSGITTTKLHFYKEFLKTNLKIHEDDIVFIYNISQYKPKTSTKIKSEDIMLSDSILNILRNSELKSILDKLIIEETAKSIPKIEFQKQKYIQYFNDLNLTGKELYPRNFNKVSKNSTESFLKTFKMNWLEILDLFNKKEDLINALLEDFQEKYKDKSVSSFLLSTGLPYDDTLDEIKDLLYSSINSKNMRDISIEGLYDNFHSIGNELNYIPFYSQFNEMSIYAIKTYSVHLGIPNSYDEIVKYYSTEEGYLDYLQRKKKHKSDIARATSRPPNKFTEEYLKSEFKKAYDSYFLMNGKYPVNILLCVSLMKFVQLTKVCTEEDLI